MSSLGPALRAGRESPFPRRWLFLGALAVAEGIALTSAFDLPSGADGGSFGHSLLRLTPFVLPACIAIATAMALFGGFELQRQVAAAVARMRRAPALWPYLAAHAFTLAGFVFLTSLVFDAELGRAGAAWVLGWLATGLVNFGLLAAAAVPPAALRAVLWRTAGVAGSGSLVGLLAWQAGRLTDSALWGALGQSTLACVHAVLRVLPGETAFDAARRTVGYDGFTVEIGTGCSGWEGIGLILVFLGAYLWYFRASLRFPGAFLLLPLGAGVIWTANVARIVALILLGARFSPEVAVTAFHARAGWLFFCAVSWALVVVARRFRFFSRDAAGAAGSYAAAPWLLPLLLVMGVGMTTGAFALGFDAFEPLAVVVGAAALWFYRDRYAGLGWGWSWTAIGAGVLVFLLWLPLAAPDAESAARAERTWTTLADLPALGAVAWLLAKVVGTLLLAPLAEELAFRGYLLRRLQAKSFESVPVGSFTVFSFLVSSLLFGLLHESWLAGFLAGAVYALVLYRRGRVGDAVLAHLVTNGLLVLYAVAENDLGYWL